MCNPHCIAYITKLSQNQINIHSFCTEPLYSTQLEVYNKGINSTVFILFVPENIAKNYWVKERHVSLHLLVP